MPEIETVLKRFPEKKILVVGDYMLDQYLSGTVSRISPEAPVPVVKIESKRTVMGGAGNVALNIAALGGKVRALTNIGTDAGGDLLLSLLGEQGIETGYVVRSGSRTTSVKTRVVAQNQQMLRYDEETIIPAQEDFLSVLRQNAAGIMEGIDAVILSDYGKGVLTADVCRLLIDEAKKKGLPVLVDPKGNDYTKYRGADYCTPNMKELREASGTHARTEEEICAAALGLCSACGIRNLLVTRSEKGMSLVDGKTGKMKTYPAIARDVSDVTGAGDTVISVFSVGIASGASPETCCRLANIAASIVVSKFGAATAAIPEIEAAIRQMNRPPETKRHTPEEMEMIAADLRAHGRKVVFTNGCFDLVHAGHIASFKKAKAMGDVLIVAVNSDASVRRLKGETRPIVDLENRLALLESIGIIDYLVPFEDDTPQTLIERIRPDILVKGKDWEGKKVAGADFLSTYGGKVAFIDLEEGLSTTNLVEKIKRSAK